MWLEQQLKKKLNRVLRTDDTDLPLLLHTWEKLSSGGSLLHHMLNVTLPSWRITSYVRISLLLAKAISLQVMDHSVTAHQVTQNPISQKHPL